MSRNPQCEILWNFAYDVELSQSIEQASDGRQPLSSGVCKAVGMYLRIIVLLQDGIGAWLTSH